MSVAGTEQNLRAVVASTWPILLDFDGPVTHFFIDDRNRRLADQLRNVLTNVRIKVPTEVANTLDPLAVLRWAALKTAPEVSRAVDAACIHGEHQCAEESEPTHGAIDLLAACQEAGRPVLIVSNNAPGPIRQFLDRYSLGQLVDAVIGRTPGRPDLMKPNRHMIDQAIAILDQPPERCAFVGDSITDIEVALKTGVRSIGYAKHQRRGEELAAAGADALVTGMSDLAVAIRSDALQRT